MGIGRALWQSTTHAIVDGFTRIAGEPEFMRVQVNALFEIHGNQWDLEDGCRAVGLDDEKLGGLKRAIDSSNAARVETINQLDTFLRPRVQQPRSDAIPWPLTCGQNVDLLVIAAVKADRLADLSVPAEALKYSMSSFRFFVQMLEQGRIVMPAHSTVKAYQGATFGAI